MSRSTRSSSRDKEEYDEIGISCIEAHTPKRAAFNVTDEIQLKRRKRRRLNHSTDDGGDCNIDEPRILLNDNLGNENQAVLKVPPLKIFFQSKESGSLSRLSERVLSIDTNLIGKKFCKCATKNY